MSEVKVLYFCFKAEKSHQRLLGSHISNKHRGHVTLHHWCGGGCHGARGPCGAGLHLPDHLCGPLAHLSVQMGAGRARRGSMGDEGALLTPLVLCPHGSPGSQLA